jgi:FMN reductase [NAD(P)H]
MELGELLERRRMVRSYAPRPVERERLERIAATIRRVPSAGYSQGQRLLLVTDADTRRQIAEIAGEEDWVARGNERWISVAPVHAFVLAREGDYHERYQQDDKLEVTGGVEVEWPVPYWFVDAGALMMTLLLAAIDEGLAAGFFGLVPADGERAKELLGIPEDLELVGALTIGYPADDSRAAEKASRRTQARKPLDDLVHWERW